MNLVEREEHVSTKHGTMPTFVVHPAGPGPWPVVILLMDAQGIREELRLHARRIAKSGFVCVLPDLYYRLGQLRFDVKHRNAAMSKAITAARLSLSDEGVNSDAAALVAFIDAEEAAKQGTVGVVGHCMSGRYVLTTAAYLRDRVAAGASLYGEGLIDASAQSPHLLGSRINAELYFGFGAADPDSPPDVVAELRSALLDSGVKFTIEVLHDAGHGYQFVERYGDSYAPAASERSWSQVLDLLHRALDPSQDR